MSENTTNGDVLKTLDHSECCFDWIKFNDLFNDDIFRLVLSYLNICDLGRFERVSKKLRICQLCGEDSELWKNYYTMKVSELIDIVNRRKSYQVVVENVLSLSKFLDKTCEFKKNTTKAIAEFNSIVQKNSEMKMKLVEEEARKLLGSTNSNANVYVTREELLKFDLSQSLVDRYYYPKKKGVEGIKIFALGDGAIGKTCLMMRLTTGHFPIDYIPTIIDSHLESVTLGENTFRVSLWDSASSDDFPRLRVLAYPQTDVFLAMYSCVQYQNFSSSFENVFTTWIPEVRYHCPEAAIVLVATKIDLRNDVDIRAKLCQYLMTPVSSEQGERVAKLSGCFTYTETSSLKNIGLSDLIELSLKAHFKNKSTNPKEKKKCCLQ